MLEADVFDFAVFEVAEEFDFEFEFVAEFVDMLAGLFDIAFDEALTELLGIEFVMLLFEVFDIFAGRLVLFAGAPPHAKLKTAIAKTISTRI